LIETLSTVGAVLLAKQHDGRAIVRLCRQALAIRRESLPSTHPKFAESVSNLAVLYEKTGDYRSAEQLYRDALRVMEETLGKSHPKYATVLTNLATLYQIMGEHDLAEPLLRQAIDTGQQMMGEGDPECSPRLASLAALCAGTGRSEEALALITRSVQLDEEMIIRVFSFVNESQRTAFLGRTEANLDVFLSLVRSEEPVPTDKAAQALTFVLHRKGLLLEMLVGQRDAALAGRHPHLSAALQNLNRVRAQIAHAVLAGPGSEAPAAYRQTITRRLTERDRLEAELARQIPETDLKRRMLGADCDAVASALPQDSVLVEFARFDVFDFKAIRDQPRWTGARYLAFILPARRPRDVQMIDLGDAEAIEAEIGAFRRQIAQERAHRQAPATERSGPPEPRLCERPGTHLRQLVFDPLGLPPGSRILISPDGDLNLLPFEALPAEDGRFLIEDYQFSYLGSGRDVLRFGESGAYATEALIVADPDFDLAVSQGEQGAGADHSTESPPGRRSRELTSTSLHFDPLSATRREGEEIAALLGSSTFGPPRVWIGSDALEARFKAVRSPMLLHVASHGFFLQDQDWSALRKEHDIRIALGTEGMVHGLGGLESPLLRSGIALAGVNAALRGEPIPPEAEDGLLTAEDVSGMSLLGTELVVLSACDTGLGEVKRGEGVFGLRRAFVHAGAATLVMSLWKVPDDETRELIVEFYRHLLAGQGRAEALRNAQLAMIGCSRTRGEPPDPFYWGAFICQGDPGPLRIVPGA